MTILSVFGFPIGIGGHFKSALSHMKYLSGKGHQVYILAPSGDNSNSLLKEFENTVEKVCFFKNNLQYKRFPNIHGYDDIVHICKEENIDVICAEDFKGVAASYIAAIKAHKGLVCVKAGGPVNNAITPRNAFAIYYSQELCNGMIARHGLDSQNISLIRARIDTDIFKPEEIKSDFLGRYNLPEKGYKISMAIRLHESKKQWLDNLFAFAEKTDSCDLPVSIVIAGDGQLRQELELRAQKNNCRNCGIKIYMIGPVFEMSELNQLYNYSDVVVGNGRGILEAMACGKTVINLGEKGEAAMVTAENIQDIAKYNFSGRHFRHSVDDSHDLASLLQALLQNDEQLKKNGQFSYEYIKKYMAAEIGARERIEVYKSAIANQGSWFGFINWYAQIIKTVVVTGVKRRLDQLRKNA